MYHVAWVWHRCGASRLTGVLSSTKILNDSSCKCHHSPYYSLSHLHILLFASLPPFALATMENFLKYRLAENYTCHDFDFDDFVIKSRFVGRLCQCSFYTLAIYTDTYAIFCVNAQIIHSNHLTESCLMAFIPHFTLFNKTQNLISLRVLYNRRAYIPIIIL